MVKLVYIAGPFSAPTREGVDANIARAVAAGLDVARLGGFPVIPHANTSHPEFESLQPYTFWIEGTAELLLRSDAVLMLDGWQKSKGASGEYALALANQIPVFFELTALEAWLKTGEAPVAEAG